jgi:hypothetical protein
MNTLHIVLAFIAGVIAGFLLCAASELPMIH